MRNPVDPKWESDVEYAEGIPEWMLKTLDYNPDYTAWGPYEDYMWTKDDGGWNSRVVEQDWEDAWVLNDLNEVVNFYFEVDKNETKCPDCENGYSPEGRRLYDGCYRHLSSARAPYWINDLTQDEVDALWEKNRIGRIHLRREGKEGNEYKPSIAEVNAMANPPRGAGIMGHDAINVSILVDARAKRLGINTTCLTCDGHAHLPHEPRLKLILWVIHPRKGSSRGVEYVDIKEEQLPEVYEYLREAARRNADRFGRLPS